MTQSILQAYLNEQHIRTDAQENIESLKKAVKEVSTQLTKRKADIIPYTLVALDPMVNCDDSVVQLVETIIIRKWPAFKNSVTATKDKSTTYIRAVILESLNQLSEENAAVTALVWLTARDVIGHYQLGLEKGVISVLLQELADRAEANGQTSWVTIPSPQKIEFKGEEISIPGLKAALIDEDALKEHLIDAAVHSGWSQSAGGGKNPYYHDQHSWQWPAFAAKQSAIGITEVVNSALSQQSKSFSSVSSVIQKILNSYFAQLQPFFDDFNKAFASTSTANNKRSELLWWKQSLYSRLLNISYRRLNPLNAAVAMALDLAELVEAIYPESVDYLLRETLRDVHGEKVEEEGLFAEWLIDYGNLHKDIKSALNKYTAVGDARKLLLSAWANVMQSGEAAEFFSETGVNKTAKLTISDLAVWLFHGLQAHKLATTK